MSVIALKGDIQLMRKSLQKAISDLNPEATLDILIAIEQLENKLTADIIKESKLGNVINSAREKFSSRENSDNDPVQLNITTKAKEILLSWKKIMEKSSSIPPSTASSSSSASVSKAEDEPKRSFEIVSKTNSGSSWSLSKLSGEPINQQRQKIVTSFVDILKPLFPTADPLAIAEVANAIERAVHGQIPFEQDAKAYSAKCRSLAFNIKRNEALARNIMSKLLPIDRLVTMTANELANNELLVTRTTVFEQELDGKRGDWYEAHRAEILEKNDIDPSNTWLFDADNGSDDEPEIAGD